MAGPPKDVPAGELFLKLLEAPAPSEVIDFPRRQDNGEPFGKIRIRVLDQESHDTARLMAHRALKDRGLTEEELKGEAVREVLGDAVARELLAMACLTETGPEDERGVPMYGRIFRNAADLKSLRPDEIAVLFSAYLMTQAKYGPFEKTIESAADLNAWIKRLEEGGSVYPLLRLQLPALAELAFWLARRAYLLSAILESLWPSLPPTFKSQLDDCSMGTGYYGKPAADSTQAGGVNSGESVVTSSLAATVASSIKDQ